MIIETAITNDLGTILTFELEVSAGRILSIEGARAESADGRECTLNHTAALILFEQHDDEVISSIVWPDIAHPREW
jgi:hypothetical protein